LTLDEHGRCEDLRIAIGSAGPTPIRALEAEQILRGEMPEISALAETGDVASRATDPIDDARGSAQYKRDMVAVIVRRSLELQTAPLRRR
jgi:carbon-monoxide dehydrogenase medium subunit